MKLLVFALAVSAVYAESFHAALTYKPPQEKNILYNSKLLHYVQMAKIFPDSKTFVDLHLKYDQKTILSAFDELLLKSQNKPTKEHLSEFINYYFDSESGLDVWTPSDFIAEPAYLATIKDPQLKQFAKNVNNIWPTLGRKIKSVVYKNPESFSLIPVQNGFIIPGGKFKEFYYGDSYWIIEGLLISGMKDTAKGMISNFVELQRRFGHIPSGDRYYYLGQSHAPVLSAMMAAYYQETKDVEFLKENMDAVVSELEYWLDTHSVVFNVAGREHSLLRYVTPSSFPRPESYYEDYTNAQAFESEQLQKQFYTDIKSAAESGWTFSSRWLINKNGSNTGDLTSIKTTDIIPVDLNAIFASALQKVGNFCSILKDTRKAVQWEQIKIRWFNSIKEVLWNDQDGIWYDWDLTNSYPRKYFYTSNLAPLWTGIVEPEFLKANSQKILNYIRKTNVLGYPGGVPTSLTNSGLPWDLPYAWPSQVSIIVNALEALETQESAKMAFEVAQTLVQSIYKGYLTNKQFYEKYDVESPGKVGNSDGYTAEEGFGWTIGVLVEMLAKYGVTMSAVKGYETYPTKFPQFSHSSSQHYNSFPVKPVTKPELVTKAPVKPVYFASAKPSLAPTHSAQPSYLSSYPSKPVYNSPTYKPESLTTYPDKPLNDSPVEYKPQYIASAPLKPEIVPTIHTKPFYVVSAPLKPGYTQAAEAKPVLVSEDAKPAYVSNDEVKPEFDLSTPSKPEYLPTTSAKPEYVQSYPAQPLFVSTNPQYTFSTKPSYITSGPVKSEHIHSTEVKPTLVSEVYTKPSYVASAPLKPGYIQSAEAKPVLVSEDAKHTYVSNDKVKPEFDLSTPTKPEYLPTTSAKPEYVPSYAAQPLFVSSLETKPQYISSTKPSYIASVPVKSEHIHSTEVKPTLVSEVYTKPSYVASAPAISEYVPSVEAKPELVSVDYAKPGYVSQEKVKPEFDLSTPSKPEYLPTTSAKPEYVPSYPAQPLFDSSFEIKPQYISSAKPAYVASAPVKPTLVSEVYTKPSYVAFAPAKPEYVSSVEAKPEFVSVDYVKPGYVSQEKVKPEFGLSTPSKPEYLPTTSAKPEYVPSYLAQPLSDSSFETKPQYISSAKPAYVASAPVKPEAQPKPEFASASYDIKPSYAQIKPQYIIQAKPISTIEPKPELVSSTTPVLEYVPTTSSKPEHGTFYPVKPTYVTNVEYKPQYISPAKPDYTVPIKPEYIPYTPKPEFKPQYLNVQVKPQQAPLSLSLSSTSYGQQSYVKPTASETTFTTSYPVSAEYESSSVTEPEYTTLASYSTPAPFKPEYTTLLDSEYFSTTLQSGLKYTTTEQTPVKTNDKTPSKPGYGYSVSVQGKPQTGALTINSVAKPQYTVEYSTFEHQKEEPKKFTGTYATSAPTNFPSLTESKPSFSVSIPAEVPQAGNFIATEQQASILQQSHFSYLPENKPTPPPTTTTTTTTTLAPTTLPPKTEGFSSFSQINLGSSGSTSALDQTKYTQSIISKPQYTLGAAGSGYVFNKTVTPTHIASSIQVSAPVKTGQKLAQNGQWQSGNWQGSSYVKPVKSIYASIPARHAGFSVNSGQYHSQTHYTSGQYQPQYSSGQYNSGLYKKVA